MLALVEGSPHGYLRLVDAAVLLTDTAGYIPADSSDELTMIDALIAARRMFFKPLRYGGTGTHPDFVLMDSTPATVVEVWGVTGREAYDARRATKEELYRAAGTPLLSWDVRDPLPAIPPPPAAAPDTRTPAHPDAARVTGPALDDSPANATPWPEQDSDPTTTTPPPGPPAGRNPS